MWTLGSLPLTGSWLNQTTIHSLFTCVLNTNVWLGKFWLTTLKHFEVLFLRTNLTLQILLQLRHGAWWESTASFSCFNLLLNRLLLMLFPQLVAQGHQSLVLFLQRKASPPSQFTEHFSCWSMSNSFPWDKWPPLYCPSGEIRVWSERSFMIVKFFRTLSLRPEIRYLTL